MTTDVDGPLSAVHKSPAKPRSRWRRAMVASSVLGGMLVTGAGLLPTVMMGTSLRNQVLGKAVKQEAWTAEAGSASGGWLAPILFHDVRIADGDGRFLCTVRELRTSRGLLGFLTGGPDIGDVTLVEPHVEVNVGEDGQWPECSPNSSDTRLNFSVENGSLLINVPWRKTPIVDVEKLAISGAVAPNDEGRRMLTVKATQIFDHEPLAESHTEQNLALIAPVLSQSTQLSGSASVWLDEIQIPLDGSRKSPFPIKGRAEFHSLQARLRQDWTRQLAAVTGQLTGTELPDQVEVLKDSKVGFVVTDEGITHDSMVFLLPEIAKEMQVTSSGVIRLDESLDLQLAVQIPKIATSNNPALALLGQLSAAPLRLNVKGTVSAPQIQLPERFDLLGEISKRVTPAEYQEETPAIPSAVTDLIQDAGNPDKAEARKALPGNILNLIRAIKEKKESKP